MRIFSRIETAFGDTENKIIFSHYFWVVGSKKKSAKIDTQTIDFDTDHGSNSLVWNCLKMVEKISRVFGHLSLFL